MRFKLCEIVTLKEVERLLLFAAFSRSTGFGLRLLHGFAGLFGTFRADFSALFAFLVHDLFATEQFDERFRAAVSLAESGESYAGVSAIAIAETSGHIPQFVH